MRKISPKTFVVAKQFVKNVKVFTTHGKQYTVYMHMTTLTSVDLLWHTAASSYHFQYNR